MDLSLILLIGGVVVILVALAFCFFGYKLARFLMPLCGVVVIEGLIYFFLFDMIVMNAAGQWLFFVGTGITIYIILFFLKRIAGFFVGLLGSVLILTFIVYAFNLHSMAYLHPVCLTLSVIAGLLAVVYQKWGVVITTSLFGACTAALVGLYIVFGGIDPAGFTSFSAAITTATKYLLVGGYLVGGVAIGFAILSVLVQVFLTAYKQILSGDIDDHQGVLPRRRQKDMVSDDTLSSNI